MSHAFLSPSAAHRWMTCAAAPALERFVPNDESSYAQEGTKAHAVAAAMLEAQPFPEADATALGEENMAHVSRYVDFVRQESAGGFRQIEMPLSVEGVTGEAGARGTADCLAIVGTTLKIIDLKFGIGVKVFAVGNPQLMIYALAAYRLLKDIKDITDIELIIFQPRIDGGHIDRWSLSPEKLEEFGEVVCEAASACFGVLSSKDIPSSSYGPCEAACKFCRAKGFCPALAKASREIALDKASDGIKPVGTLTNDQLSWALDHVGMVESWCKAVRERALSELQSGQCVPGYKLVAGRRGARKWADESNAEKVLKSMRIKASAMYAKKLISPTQAEKLHKSGGIGARQWPRVKALMTQADGAPTIAKESDPRPALQTTLINHFESLEG